MTFDQVYYTAMAVNVFIVAPLGLLVVGSLPCSCSRATEGRNGCCTPEPVGGIYFTIDLFHDLFHDFLIYFLIYLFHKHNVTQSFLPYTAIA